MPVLVDRRQVAFVVDQLPLIVLQGLPDAHGLPLIQVDDGQVGPCPGWTLTAQPTVCAVDGPGDAGLLLPVFADEETFEAVAQHQRWLFRCVRLRRGGPGHGRLPDRLDRRHGGPPRPARRLRPDRLILKR